MAKIAQKDEALWLRRITQALAWRKQYTFEDQWQDISRIYQHNFSDANMPHFNLIYMMGQTLTPALVFQAPGIINTPTNQESVFWASFFDSIDSWWIRHSEMKNIAKEAVLSSYLYNTTATQIGFDFDSPSDFLNRDEESVFGKIEGEVDRTREKNSPWVDVVPSHRFLVSVGTRTMRNCAWAAKLVSTPVSSLRKIKGLKNVGRTSLPQEISCHEHDIWEHKNVERYCHFWEVHDAEKGQWFWLSTDGNYIMPPESDPLQVYGLPFEVLSFNTNTKSIWGTPDAIYVKSQQLEGDECRRLGMFQRRLALPKCFYNSNVISPDKLAAYLTTNVGAGIPVDLPPDGDISKHIIPIVPPTANFLYSQYQRDLLNDAQLINGFGPNQMGTFASGRRTKYETQVVEQSNTTRLAHRRNSVADMIQGHTTRANSLISKNWTGDIVEQVVGVDGALYWVKASAKKLAAIRGGLVSEVNVESLAPVSRERRKMEAGELLKLLGTMQQAGANPMPILKQLLSTYEWVDVRMILPQMYDQMTMEEFERSQKEAISKGGVGALAAQNAQGVMALAQRMPEDNTIGVNANGLENTTEGNPAG